MWPTKYAREADVNPPVMVKRAADSDPRGWKPVASVNEVDEGDNGMLFLASSTKLDVATYLVSIGGVPAKRALPPCRPELLAPGGCNSNA